MDSDVQDEKDLEAPRKRPVLIYVIIAFFLILIPIVLLIVSIYRKSTGFKPNNLVETIDYFRASYVPDQLIVELKDEYTEQELQNLKSKFEELGVISQQKAYKNNKEYLKDYYLLQFKPGTDLRRAKEELDKTGVTVESHPNYIFKIQDSPPNDPFYTRQWNLAKIDMPNAWVLAHGSNDIKVAILDTGIDYNHPDFAGRTIIAGPNYITGGFDPYDGQGHGTHVAGTIGSVTNNSVGVVGINRNVTLMIIKSQDDSREGNGSMQSIINGMQYAIDNHADVINMSLTSGKDSVMKCTQLPELQKTINDAVLQNVVIVVAAGNGSRDASFEVPPSCSNIIVVGSSDPQDKRYPTSNYGARVDLAAPGVGIMSTIPGGAYDLKTGTSMTAPHVAGVAALLLSLNPGLTPPQVRDCLVNYADSIVIMDNKPIGPRLNAFKTLNACSGLPKLTPTPTNTPLPLSGQATPTIPIVQSNSQAKPAVKKSPTPTPRKYTCQEQTGSNTPSGAIQIGVLVCTPNP